MSNATYREMTGPHGLIALNKSFTGNSLSARWLRPGEWPGRGHLNAVEAQRLEFDYQTANDMGTGMYVVYSYATPIAWAIQNTRSFSPLPAYCVEQRFSVTTSKGQGYVRAWINHRYESLPAHVSGGYATYRAERERLGV